jgi:hypothetical protein
MKRIHEILFPTLWKISDLDSIFPAVGIVLRQNQCEIREGRVSGFQGRVHYFQSGRVGTYRRETRSPEFRYLSTPPAKSCTQLVPYSVCGLMPIPT